MSQRKREGVMLAKPFEQHLLDRMPDHVLFQPKLDGVRIRAVWCPVSIPKAAPTYKLFSSTGRPVESLPDIIGGLNSMAEIVKYKTLDGEVCAEDMKLQQIMSIVSKTTSIDEYHWMLSYCVFDTIEDRPQQLRIFDLLSHDIYEFTTHNDNIEVVPTFLSDKANWQAYVSRFVDLGYEGLIIRDPRVPYICGKVSSILKVKPTKQDKYRITGCQQAISIGGEPRGMVGAFNLVDSLGNYFKAGAGRLDYPQRVYWWEHKDELLGKICVVEYLTLTERGVPREPVTLSIKEAPCE